MSQSLNDFDDVWDTGLGTRWGIRLNDDGTTTAAMQQDCTGIIDAAADMRSGGDGWTEDKTFCRLSSVPFVVLQDWKNMGVDWNDPDGAKWIVSKLMSNEYYKLRTGNVKV